MQSAPTPPGDLQTKTYAGHMLEVDFHLVHANALRRARGGAHRLGGHLGRQFQSSRSFCTMHLHDRSQVPTHVLLPILPGYAHSK